MSRLCRHCKEPLSEYAHPNVKYCDDACRKKAKVEIMRKFRKSKLDKESKTITCPVCGKRECREVLGMCRYCKMTINAKKKKLGERIELFVWYDEDVWPKDEMWPERSGIQGVKTTDPEYAPLR